MHAAVNGCCVSVSSKSHASAFHFHVFSSSESKCCRHIIMGKRQRKPVRKCYFLGMGWIFLGAERNENNTSVHLHEESTSVASSECDD